MVLNNYTITKILHLLDEIDEESEMCCSTTMNPEYIIEKTNKIRKILRSYE